MVRKRSCRYGLLILLTVMAVSCRKEFPENQRMAVSADDARVLIANLLVTDGADGSISWQMTDME